MSNINIKVGQPTENYMPDGEYECILTEWHLPKQNKAGTGQITLVIFDVSEGQYKNKKIFKNLNLIHSNPITQKIAELEKNKILIAIGFNIDDVITDTNQLIRKHIKINLVNDGDNQKLKYYKSTYNNSKQPSDLTSNDEYGLPENEDMPF